MEKIQGGALPPRMGLESLTESAQPRATRPAKKRAAPTYARPSSQKQTVVFDEDARREYLTGFSKRKTQRRQAAQAHVQHLIRDEIRQARLAAAEARKRQAAENVRAERLAYGLADDNAQQDDDDDRLDRERDFESDEHRAHVTVQTLDLDHEDAPLPTPRATPPPKPQTPRTTPAPPTVAAPSGSLTGILEPDVAHAAMSDHVFPTVAARTERERPTTYTSKAERMQERQRQRARNHAQAEKRRAQHRAQHAAKKSKTTKSRRS